MTTTKDEIEEDLVSQFKTATVTLSFLNTNGTSHANPLSAIAELTDNSKDAKATRLDIDFVERDGLETIEVLDNGTGMLPHEAANIIAFGHSNKRSENTEMIGRYGNGLKSGGLRLGSELLLLTKKDRKYTAMLISNRFHETRGYEQQVFVPCPSFDERYNPITNNPKLHEAEVKVIEKYGPLGKKTLQSLFRKIKSPSGTLIIIDNLKRDLLHNRLELNFSNKEDFQLDIPNSAKWETSLRAFLEILYQHSRMKIYLRDVEVKEKLLYADWMFKMSVAKDNLLLKEIHAMSLKEANDKCNELNNRISDINQQIAQDNNKVQAFRSEGKTQQQQNRVRHETTTAELKKVVAEKSQLEKMKGKTVPTIIFSIGVNVEDRSADGIYFYLNNRLIKVFHNNKFYTDKLMGISGQVNFSYDFFTPTQSKTDFANQKDFQSYLKLCKDWLQIYENEIQTEMVPNFLTLLPQKANLRSENIMDNFWRAVGYTTANRQCIRSSLSKTTSDLIQRNAGYYRRCKLCDKWNGVPNDPGSAQLECKKLGTTCQETKGDTMFAKLKMELKTDPAKKKNNAQMKSQTRSQPAPIAARASRSEAESLVRTGERLADESRPRRSGTKRDYREDSPAASLDDGRPHRNEHHPNRADDDSDEEIVELEAPPKKSKTCRSKEMRPGSPSPSGSFTSRPSTSGPSTSGPSTSGPVACSSSRSRLSISVAPTAVKPPTDRVPSVHRDRSSSSSSSFNSSPKSTQASRRPPQVLERPFVSEHTGYHLPKTFYDEYNVTMKNLETVMSYWAANAPGGITVGSATKPSSQLSTVADKIRAMNQEKNGANQSRELREPKQEPRILAAKPEPKTPTNLRKHN